ncbi:MAG: homocysteine S-methyltransferase family protein [Lachnospiraceae bacterium]|nr:homocysteine S-methyltransferase family protein [Lachnospiraceae bacterium]
MKEFRELLKENRMLYLDGAMGTNLQKRGLPQGVCPEKWLTENQDILYKLQKEYVDAGTDILYVPTFTANRIKLAEFGLEKELDEINKTLVKVSRSVADSVDRDVYISADLSMTGLQLKPMGPLDFEELVDVYKQQVKAICEAGVDLITIETMMSLNETRAAVIASKEACDLPIFATLTFNEDGRTLYGTDPETAAIVLESLGIDAIGANCSTGPKDMVDIIRTMSESCHLPIIAKPNAGIPRLDENGTTVYDNTPDNFAEEMKLLIDVGATIVGGCCGTDPDYIGALVNKNYSPVTMDRTGLDDLYKLTSERRTLKFSLDDSFMVIGERINPTGKKALQEDLRNGITDKIAEFAEQQEENGANILDVNLGMDGIDEKAMMIRVVDELQGVTNLPLCIDSSHVDVIEAALRRYPGRALINSISYESKKIDALLPIAKKYGAAFILLPLSDEGLPKSLDEKIDIIGKVSERAHKMGFTKRDIVVDGLVNTVGANPLGGVETLETFRYCKQNGYATTCGLSNISFGLPERSYINAAFLAMAIEAGATMAIANPNQVMLMNIAYACNILKARPGADLKYIERIDELKEAGLLTAAPTVGQAAAASGKGGATASAGTPLAEASPRDELKNAVLKGKKNTVQATVLKCLDSGEQPQSLLSEVLIAAINEVGDLFEQGKYFLPQLINSAETMKTAIEVLEPLLAADADDSEKHTVVIATVAGDIHDIGKNLVSLMLKNYGFNVIDLGKDVDRDLIINTAIKENAEIIALSALMTTTMREMDEVVKATKTAGCNAKIIIGGAVTTQEYADEIGADGYSTDAADCVKTCKRLLGIL